MRVGATVRLRRTSRSRRPDLVDGLSVDGVGGGMDQSIKLTLADVWWETAQQGRHHLLVRGYVPETIEWLTSSPRLKPGESRSREPGFLLPRATAS